MFQLILIDPGANSYKEEFSEKSLQQFNEVSSTQGVET